MTSDRDLYMALSEEARKLLKLGPLGGTCHGCAYLQPIEYADGQTLEGCTFSARVRETGPDDHVRWSRGRGCAAYEARNGEVTEPMFPFKPGSTQPQDVGTVLLLLKAEREP